MPTRREFLRGAAAGLAACSFPHVRQPQDVPSVGISEIEVTLIDRYATPYGTFQSHNQNIVKNHKGIFVTYIRTRNESYTAQEWRLLQSTDGGNSFSLVYQAVDPTSPPALETDERANLYLFRPNWLNHRGYFYRFLAVEDYRIPHISEFLMKPVGGKYCMVYDRSRCQFYVALNRFWFLVIDRHGKLRRSVKLWTSGHVARMEYPQLGLDETGTLHVAWTTNPYGRQLYRSIHHMQSRDGGKTWERMDGQPLTPPIIPDDTGPTQQISLDWEYDEHTWLASFISKGRKIHFVYSAREVETFSLKRMHYARYDTSTGQREVHRSPSFRGERIALTNLSGFFASRDRLADSPLYCVMSDAQRIACLASHTNGESWFDYARDTTRYRGTYAVSGAREVTDDGYILGSFTNRKVPIHDPLRVVPVYFFKIKTDLPPTASAFSVTLREGIFDSLNYASARLIRLSGQNSAR